MKRKSVIEKIESIRFLLVGSTKKGGGKPVAPTLEPVNNPPVIHLNSKDFSEFQKIALTRWFDRRFKPEGFYRGTRIKRCLS